MTKNEKNACEDTTSKLETLSKYCTEMDWSMEMLSLTVLIPGHHLEGSGVEDHKIIDVAVKQINVLKELLTNTGFNPKLLEIILRNV